MAFRFALMVCLVVGLAGCRQETPGQGGGAGAKTYAMRGKIVAVDEAVGELTIDHGVIPGFMEAMTMPYRLAEPGTISEMHVGDVITARVGVQGI